LSFSATSEAVPFVQKVSPSFQRALQLIFIRGRDLRFSAGARVVAALSP
jgi:hypothetical protein